VVFVLGPLLVSLGSLGSHGGSPGSLRLLQAALPHFFDGHVDGLGEPLVWLEVGAEEIPVEAPLSLV